MKLIVTKDYEELSARAAKIMLEVRRLACMRI